jgi:hypothetical protein
MLLYTSITEQKIAQKWKKRYVLQNAPCFKLSILAFIPETLNIKRCFAFYKFKHKIFD